MFRFVVYTRGRTGSSPIVEELNNHRQIICHGEVMRPDPLARVHVRKAFERFGKDYPSSGQTRDRVLPYKLFRDESPDTPVSDEGFAAYLAYLDDDARSAGARAIGWKMITRQWPGFFELCARNDVSIVYLRRRNLLRQAVSAVVALETKVYNLPNYQPEPGRRFAVPPEQVTSRINNAKNGYANHDRQLARLGIDAKVVYYEDWLNDREAFFADLGPALGVDPVTPDSTTLSRVTPEPLEEIIENYDTFASAVEKAGFGEFLGQRTSE